MKTEPTTSLPSENQLSDNELIAEFMDGYKLQIPLNFWYISSYGTFEPRHMKYGTSWDWLMPVVEKIESALSESGASMSHDWYFWNDRFDGQVNTDIRVTYQCVVDFIKWYNNQPKP